MEAVAQPVREWPRPLVWLREFLAQELAPYPGRSVLVAQMVVSATLIMLITMTFRLPFGTQAIFALLVARETHWATLRAVKMAIPVLALAAGYVVLGTIVSLGSPLVRTLWVIVSLFIAFFTIRVISDYGTALGFGIIVGLCIPVLDAHISTELKVTQTLWAAGQSVLAGLIAALVAVLFVGLKPGDLLVRFIAERLASVENLLKDYAAGQPVQEQTAKEVARMAMLGTSLMRRNIRRSSYARHYAEQMSVVVALVGRLVDLAALVSLDVRVSEAERERIQTLAQNIATLRGEILRGRIPHLDPLPVHRAASLTAPHLPLMEETVSGIAEVFAGLKSPSAYAPPLLNQGDPPPRLLVPDWLSNPEHFKFALKGCLAASLCYLIYTALDWRGISTAVITCILTALTTIGSSRQKQVLRILGAIVGGFVIGMGSQVFILPSLDSITGFTILFVIVSIIAAWFATAGPRLSYFGIQVALAFYLINLQEFTIQTSLTVARDRVVGIFLGLSMMWLVFDQLWGAPAAVEMRKMFLSLFRLLAQLAREPVSNNPSVALAQSDSLRETINGSFNQLRADADALWLEFGPSRQQDLALRSRIVGWQPTLRILFINCAALLKYRLQFPGFELPEPVRLALRQFAECLAGDLDRIADHLQGKAQDQTQKLDAALARLRDAVRNSAPAADQETLTARMEAMLSLSERIAGLAAALAQETQGGL